MYKIQRNGIWNTDLGIMVRERPGIPGPELKCDQYEIPNKDGVLFVYDDVVEDITINVTFSIAEKEEYQEKLRLVRKWLLSREDNILKLSDDPHYFYKVKTTKIKSATRSGRKIGAIEVGFVCEGYQYSDEGQQEITASNLYNDGYITHPIYKVEGEGECTLTVNGKAVKANVGQNLTIDTDRMIAYRTDGTMQNTSLTGDYEDLYLIEGENKVSITSGFVLKIIPNWRYL